MIELDGTERQGLEHLIRTLMRVREVDAEMPAQTLYALLEIVKRPGITMIDLQRLLGMSSAGTSRIVSRLVDVERPGVPGLGFARRTENSADRRNKVVHPTPQGIAFVRRIMRG